MQPSAGLDRHRASSRVKLALLAPKKLDDELNFDNWKKKRDFAWDRNW
jgi:hypothetical protein